MYCQRCGKENTDTSKFCIQCGAPLGNIENIPKTSNGVLDYVKNLTKNQILFIVLMILSAIGVFIPFAKWVKIPAYQMFSALEKYSSYSIFGFFDAANSYGSSSGGFMDILDVIIILGMIASSVLYAIFIIMAFKKNRKCFLFSMIASIVRLINTILFMILMALITVALFNTIQTTWTPLFSLLISIANIVLTVIVKGNSKNNSENGFV